MHGKVPEQIRSIEFSCLYFILQFEEDCDVTLATILQLRREFRRVMELLGIDDRHTDRLKQLLSPPGFSDPVARRRYRHPSPGFVIRPPEGLPRHCEAGDELALPVLFLGRARIDVDLFAQVLTALGQSGLSSGMGRFALLEIDQALDSAPGRRLWTPGKSASELSVPYQDLGWWLDQRNGQSPVRLALLTPARLLRNGKPLFRGDFQKIFPFALRRVTSMLYAWGDCEPEVDIAELLRIAGEMTVLENTLSWHDWRVLEGSPQGQEIGGLTGELVLDGAGCQSLSWVLHLLELFNLGKGAAYGAGQCLVR